MPRQERLDFRDALHFVRLRGNEGLNIFFDAAILRRGAEQPRQLAPDVRRFERLLAVIGEECGAVLHGYSIEPNSCILVLQTTGASLNAFTRRLCGQYSRYLHRQARLTTPQSAFASRYDSRLIAPEYLPHAVRRAHRAPVISGWCNQRIDYPFSSERAYAGERSPLPVRTADTRKILERRGLFGPQGYRNFMDQPESALVTEFFTRGSPFDPRIVGNRLFVSQVRQLITHPPARPRVEQVVAGVAALMSMAPADIHANTHDGVLARSLVAWHALRTGAATLTTVGKWFSLTGATLGQSMHHYRRAMPDLFNTPIKLEPIPDQPKTALQDEGSEDEDDDDTDDADGDSDDEGDEGKGDGGGGNG